MKDQILRCIRVEGEKVRLLLLFCVVDTGFKLADGDQLLKAEKGKQLFVKILYAYVSASCVHAWHSQKIIRLPYDVDGTPGLRIVTNFRMNPMMIDEAYSQTYMNSCKLYNDMILCCIRKYYLHKIILLFHENFHV